MTTINGRCRGADRPLHSWRVSPREAIALQRRLATRVIRRTDGPAPRLIAGLDAAFSRDGKWCFAAVVVWDFRRAQVVGVETARRRLVFPYIPGLLSFREAPALLAALGRLDLRPDLLLCDGQGLAHPRRFGIACHLGVITGLPAIGCAKSRLLGQHQEPGRQRGDWAPLRDGVEVVGCVLRTQDGVRPLYVSIGHRIGLGRARGIVLDCATRYRLPEPTRLADQKVAAVKREAMSTCG